MIAALDVVIEGESPSEVLRSTSEIGARLSRHDQKRFTDVRFEYIAAYGESGMADRLRGKTVRQAINEFEPTDAEPIGTGVTNGVEWKLYAKPSDRSVDNTSDSDGDEPE